MAEEASIVDEQNQMLKLKKKFFKKVVNSLQLSIININFMLILAKKFNGDKHPSNHPSLAGCGYANRLVKLFFIKFYVKFIHFFFNKKLK